MAVRCQRIGCDALFHPEKNDDENVCCYHPGPPLFHDGGKQWSCCKQRSHDFSLFLSIPGCTYGKHSSEKPQTKAASVPSQRVPAPAVQASTHTADCSRCKQGFFCSDHGSTIKAMQTPSLEAPKKAPSVEAPAFPKVIDMNVEQKCTNKGCGKTFKERDNHESACSYHPGPAVFHDRSKGWACCDVHVKEFEEFLEILPCSKGWHSGN